MDPNLLEELEYLQVKNRIKFLKGRVEMGGERWVGRNGRVQLFFNLFVLRSFVQ